MEEEDLHLWLCSRERVADSDAFKRGVLGRYVDAAPECLEFEEGEHGKPALVGAPRPLEFNLSHSGDWLICAVTGGIPVGVDLEFCNPRRASLKVAKRFFRAAEVAVLESCSDSLLTQRFFDFWTLKESAVKARGEALAPGLSAHGFRLDMLDETTDKAGEIAVDSSVPDEAHYMLLDPVAQYRVAVCWMGDAGRSPRMSFFDLDEQGRAAERTVPLRADKLPE